MNHFDLTLLQRVLQTAARKLRDRDGWLTKDNPGMACKYHNHAEGLLEFFETITRLTPAKDEKLTDRLAAAKKRLARSVGATVQSEDRPPTAD